MCYNWLTAKTKKTKLVVNQNGKVVMKMTKANWFELNSGNLVNLENVQHITLEGEYVVYHFTNDRLCAESFKSPSDAQHRMEELKKLLK